MCPSWQRFSSRREPVTNQLMEASIRALNGHCMVVLSLNLPCFFSCVCACAVGAVWTHGYRGRNGSPGFLFVAHAAIFFSSFTALLCMHKICFCTSAKTCPRSTRTERPLPFCLEASTRKGDERLVKSWQSLVTRLCLSLGQQPECLAFSLL